MNRTFLPSPGARLRPRRQRGNALIMTFLALIVSALGMAGYMEGKQVEIKTNAGKAEATVLELLRNATNALIFEHTTDIQQGQSLSKTIGGNTITITPSGQGADMVWKPSLDQLRDMGYLPTGWNTSTSALNDAPYAISFSLKPAGCATVNCNIEGAVVIQGPILDLSTKRSDGIVIGPILQKIGADSAVSLVTGPSKLLGFDETWEWPNPVEKSPPGVVAVRVGNTASAYAAFVRLGDLRDPKLAGDLSAQGNLSIGGTSTLNGAVTLNNASLQLNGAAGTTCVSMLPTGKVSINCDGAFNTKTGTFAAGLSAGNLALGSTDPNTLSVSAGDLFVKGSAGDMVRLTSMGDVEASRDLKAGRALSAPTLQLTTPVSEGTACQVGEVSSLTGGGLAVCLAGTYVAAVRYGTHKTACTTAGSRAIDPVTTEDLLCRNGRWGVATAFVSDSVFMGSASVGHGDTVPMPPCRDTGTQPPTAALYLMPANEATAPVLNRSASIDPNNTRTLINGYHLGGAWIVSLRNGDNIGVVGNSAIAQVYCRYQ